MRRIVVLVVYLFLVKITLGVNFSFTTGNLFYKIINDSSVSVTYPNYEYTASGHNYYKGYSKPTGNLIIPSSVYYNFGNYTSDGRTYSVISIDDCAFYDCRSITSVTLPNTISSIGNTAFYNCSSMEYLTIGDSITNIGNSAFNNCSSLTSVTIPNSVTSIGERAFYNCSGLITATIGEGVTSIGNEAFSRCTGLATVVIGNSVTSIGREAFYGCSGLTEITIPDSVSNIGEYAFAASPSITSLSIGKSVTNIGRGAFGSCPITYLYYDAIDCWTLASNAFSSATHTNLQFVTIGNDVQNIPEDLFFDCNNLSYVNYNGNISDWCEITFGNSYSNPMYYAANLHLDSVRISNLIIPDNVHIIKPYTFINGDCISSINISNILEIGNFAFSDCDSILTLDTRNVISVGSSAFADCDRLVQVNIGDSAHTIGNNAFANCFRMSSVNLGDSLHSIGDSAFIGCVRLVSPTLPPALEAIGNSAFSGCSQFNGMLTLPQKILQIGDSAYFGCSEITAITAKPINPPQISENTFSGINSNVPVYVPCGRELNYYITNYWENFPNIQEAFVSNITLIPNNETMGTVNVIQQPNCSDGTAIIQANANEGYQFVQWNDGNTENPRAIIVTGDALYIATFAEAVANYTITVVSANPNYGTVTGGGTYAEGTEITLTATPNEGYEFVQWSDENTENPRTITVTGDAMYIASFAVATDPTIYNEITASACENYTWNNATYTASGEYTQTFTASNSADSIVTLHLTIYPLAQPEITIDGILDACNPSSVTLSAGEYSQYIWSTEETTSSIVVTTPDNYFVEVVDEHGCHGFSEEITIGYSNTLTEAPQIRGVGMSRSGGIVIEWRVASTEGIAGFDIYREDNVANVYTCVKHINRPGVRSCIDPTANPSARAYRYKVCAVDECGGLSPMSEPHKTMHLTINRGIGNNWNLIWSPYEGLEFGTYKIYRGTSMLDMVVIGEVPSTLNSFTDSDNPNSIGFFYQVEVVRNPGTKDGEEEISLRSNVVDNGIFPEYTITAVSSNPSQGTVTGGGTYPEGYLVTLTANAFEGYTFVSWSDNCTENPREIIVSGDAMYIATFAPATDISDIAMPEISIYPNPTNNILNITSSETISEIEIVNVLGQVIYRAEVNADNAVCDVNGLTAGIYIVRIHGTDTASITQKKFIKE